MAYGSSPRNKGLTGGLALATSTISAIAGQFMPKTRQNIDLSPPFSQIVAQQKPSQRVVVEGDRRMVGATGLEPVTPSV